MNERLKSDGRHGVPSDLGYIVDEYLCEYPSESGALIPLTEQLGRGGDITRRSASPGHVTASGIVLSRGAVLLVFHPYLKRWLQPGGHVESSEAPSTPPSGKSGKKRASPPWPTHGISRREFRWISISMPFPKILPRENRRTCISISGTCW